MRASNRPTRRRQMSATQRAWRWRMLFAALTLVGLTGAIIALVGPSWRTRTVDVSEADEPPVRQPHLLTGSDAARFPIYAPQYPGSSISDAQHLVDAAGTTMMIRFDSGDPPATVADFYMRVLSDKAFHPTLRHLDGRRLVAGGRASAGLSVLIEARPDASGSGTAATLTISDYQPTRPANMDAIR